MDAIAATTRPAEHRLPREIEDFIIEMCEAPHRHHARLHLDLGDRHALEAFVNALEGDMEVHQDVVDSDPEEVCVRATGVDARGAHWRGNSIILLAPIWARDSESSVHLAEVIVDHWERLREIHAATKDERLAA